MSEQLPWILGVTAALLHTAGYVLYNKQTKTGESKPNIVSWSIWAFMAGLNAFSFAEVSSLAHALQYVVGTFAAIITFLLSLVWGKFARPQKKEVMVFFLCIVAIIVWRSFNNAAYANSVFIIAFVISFWPTLEQVYKDPTKEKSLPWIIWTAAFATNLLNNIISWQGKISWDGELVSILNPLILLACHASIIPFAQKSRKQH